MYVSGVQFPLLAVLLPKFKSILDSKYENATNAEVTKVRISEYLRSQGLHNQLRIHF